MLEISEKEWKNVKNIHQNALDKIEYLEEERINLAKETARLAKDNIVLELQKVELEKKLKIESSNLSTVLETLQQAFKSMEKHGLMKKTKTITALDLKV